MRTSLLPIAVLLSGLLLPASALGNQLISGTYVQFYYDSSGVWNNSSGAGLQVRDSASSSWRDVSYPGSPWQQITLEFNYGGSAYAYEVNYGSSRRDWTTVSESNTSSGTSRESTYRLTASPFSILKTETWSSSGKVVLIRFRLTNGGSTTVSDLRLMHGVDPDQDLGLYGTFTTYNDVLDLDGDGRSDWVEARGYSSGWTVAYGLCDDSREDVGVTGWSTDADASFTDPGGSAADDTIHWRHRETSVAAGATADMAFVLVFDTSYTAARALYLSTGLSSCASVVRCDEDGDGYDALSCGGLDCDDTDARVNPGMTETWYDGIDADCDGRSDYDQDRDGYDHRAYGGADCDDTDARVNPGMTETWYDGIDADCDGRSDYDQDRDGYDHRAYGGTDCDDLNAARHPGATESADGVDNDCDGLVDDGTDRYDDDGDGYAELGGDCDDRSPTTHPGAVEVADGLDNDCDGLIDEDTSAGDDDGDGFSEDRGDCNDADPSVHPGARELPGDGVDNDCDGVVDLGAFDADGDGYTVEGGDCDDGSPTTRPGAVELPDGVDNDCDGLTDEDTAASDDDGDGFSERDGDCDDGDPTISPDEEEIAGNGIDDDCDGRVDGDTPWSDDDEDGYTEEAGDCDDADPSVGPGAPEDPLNGLDDDCDGLIDETDEDLDGDGFTPGQGDCDDASGWVNPGTTEFCDGLDNNCDGSIDEGCEEADTGTGLKDPGACGCHASAPHRGLALGFLALLGAVLRRRRGR